MTEALRAAGLVELQEVVPDVILDIRYATADNFARRRLYLSAKCYLQRAVAERLAAVQAELRRDGQGLLVFDGYRPFSVQEQLWAVLPDERYVGRPLRRDGVPVDGSRHNRGAAVDLTLVDSRGCALPMPSGFDEFSAAAHRDYRGASASADANRRTLERVMGRHGFLGLPTEWWHFDAADWHRYALLDIPVG